MYYMLAFLFLAQSRHVSIKVFKSLCSFWLRLHCADAASSLRADVITVCA